MTGFAAKMSALADEDLGAIAFSTESDGYEPAAISAAKLELEQRGVSQADLAHFFDRLSKEKKEDDNKHLLPLGNAAWVVFALLGPFVLVIIAAATLGFRGYTQKCKDAFIAILAGFILYGIIATLIAVL